MGVRLLTEVLRQAPAELTAAERLVLTVLALHARDETRESWPGADVIEHMTGLGPTGVRRALNRLRDRGLDVRVPILKDKSGQQRYAVRGHRTVYRIPNFPGDREIGRPTGLSIDPGMAGPEACLSEEIDRPTGPDRQAYRSTKTGPQASPVSQEPSGIVSSSAREEPTEEERAAVLAEVRRRKPGASAALIAFVARDDGPAILAEIRENNARANLTATLAELRTRPPCEDGHPGGDQLHPVSGEPLCAMCRVRRKQAVA